MVGHSINRAGWIGPIGVGPRYRRLGVGRALLGAACADLRSAGLADAHISGSGPIEFFVRSTGASVARVFVPAVLPRSDPHLSGRRHARRAVARCRSRSCR